MRHLNVFASVSCVGLVVVALGLEGRRPAQPADPVAFVPADAALVMGVNVTEIRGTHLWGDSVKNVLSGLAPSQLAGCGLDLAEQVDSLVLALPQEQAAGESDFVAVVKGRFDDVGKLLDCARGRATKAGTSVRETRIGEHTAYRFGEDSPLVSCLDTTTCLAGSAGWIAKALDLVDDKPGARSVTAEPTMSAVLVDTNRGSGVWWAGTLPQAWRDSLGAAGAGTQDALSSVHDTHGSLAFRNGLDARLQIGVSTASQAQEMAAGATAQLGALVGNAQVQATGLSEHLRHITCTAKDTQVVLQASFNPRELDDLVDKIEDLGAKAAAMGREQGARMRAGAVARRGH